MPRVLRERPFILILGPPGVGKSAVAERLFDDDAVSLQDSALREGCVRAVRRQRWPSSVEEARRLIIDGPTFLNRRPGATRLLSELIASRVAAGLRTIVCQGAETSATLLLDAVEPHQRATLTLRFPINTGRDRFARRICDERGWPRAALRGLEVEEPWTYAGVIGTLEARAAALEDGGDA